MADNKVAQSIESPDGQVCVDVFRRPDGSWGFEAYRRDPEDPSGWFATGHHAGRVFQDQASANRAAQQAVPWIADIQG